MLCSCQSGIRKRATLPLALWLFSAAAILFAEACYAQTSTELPIVPKPPVGWTLGPAQVKLGTIADLTIPQGYKFTDAQGGKDELAQLKVFIPDGLLGVIEPTSGGGCITVQFSNVGYIGGAENSKAALNESGIMTAVSKSLKRQNIERSNQGLGALSAIAWESQPALDSTKLSLEWALRADVGSEHVVVHTIRLFARRGVLDLATIRSAKSSEPDQLKDIAQNISFPAGEAYADFAAGDKIAAVNLTDLAIDSNSGLPAGDTWHSGLMGNQKTLWLIGAGILVLVMCGIVLVRKSHNRKSTHSSSVPAAEPVPAPAPERRAPVAAAKPVISVQAPAAPKPRTMSQLAMNKAAGFPKPINHSDNNGQHGANRRKRMFDYNRYFTDLMSAVSSQANQADVYQANGYSPESGRIMSSNEQPLENGTTVGNGQSAELIAHQKLLIEEQKRLIQEQSKLIEEKSRLISEKNQLLKMQADLMDGKLL